MCEKEETHVLIGKAVNLSSQIDFYPTPSFENIYLKIFLAIDGHASSPAILLNLENLRRSILNFILFNNN